MLQKVVFCNTILNQKLVFDDVKSIKHIQHCVLAKFFLIIKNKNKTLLLLLLLTSTMTTLLFCSECNNRRDAATLTCVGGCGQLLHDYCSSSLDCIICALCFKHQEPVQSTMCSKKDTDNDIEMSEESPSPSILDEDTDLDMSEKSPSPSILDEDWEEKKNEKNVIIIDEDDDQEKSPAPPPPSMFFKLQKLQINYL